MIGEVISLAHVDGNSVLPRVQQAAGECDAVIRKRSVNALANGRVALVSRAAVRRKITRAPGNIIPVDLHDQGALKIGGKRKIQRRRGTRSGGQVERNRGRGGVVISRRIHNNGLNKVPVRGPATLANDIVQAIRKIERIFEKFRPDRHWICRTGTDIADPPVFTVAEFCGGAIGIANLKNCRAHAGRRPCHRPEIIRRTRCNSHAEWRCRDV